MNKHKSNKIKENSNTVRHLIMGQITTTQNLVAIKEVRHAGQWRIMYMSRFHQICLYKYEVLMTYYIVKHVVFQTKIKERQHSYCKLAIAIVQYVPRNIRPVLLCSLLLCLHYQFLCAFTHIRESSMLNEPYVSVHYVIIGSDNGLSPVWCQTITWISAGILLNGQITMQFE